MAYLNIPAWAWAATIAAFAVLVGADLYASSRRQRPDSLPEAALWAAAAVVAALGFGALLATTASGAAARQFYAGWLTEYSLSVDNLFVFVLLISRSAVPRRLHGRVLLLGILLALLLRGIFIGFSAAALHRFGWVEYVFGAVLLAAAVRTALPGDGLPRPARWAARRGAGGGRAGGRLVTPLVMLIVTIGVTDLMFAFDSIPAIFGLTRDPFLVFTANMFALIGLRHLYVLVGGLLGKLAHLSAGLAVILGLIGIKIIGQAMRDSGIQRVGPVPVPAISAEVSLAAIGAVLAATIISSMIAARRGRESPGPDSGRQLPEGSEPAPGP